APAPEGVPPRGLQRRRPGIRPRSGGLDLPVSARRMSALTSHDLGHRSSQTELMDTEPVDIDEYRRCLQDLANVNTVTLMRRPILRWLKRVMSRVDPGERISLIDVGYGYGDVLRAIHAWGPQRGFAPAPAGPAPNPMPD